MRRKLKIEISPNFWEALWPVLIVLFLYILSSVGHAAFASTVQYSGRLSSSDYLYGSKEQYSDSLFDSRPIDLNVRMGVNSDCGNINFQATLQSTMDQILDKGFLGSFAKRMADAAPMLGICYLSPTLCSILKHSQLSANLVSQLRLNQCALIDKYVDSRVEDYYQERQSCMHRAIQRNGGNMDSAMESCGGSGATNMDLSNWAGSRFGDKVTTNKLLESSAKWAGFGNDNSPRSPLNLVKALVGDTVLSRGSISVEYGPRGGPITPRTYLQSLEKSTYEQLCGTILGKINDAGNRVPIEQLVSDADLKALSPNPGQLLVDRQPLRSLSYMNPKQRLWACKKLSDATAMTLFSSDVNRSLDMLTTLSQNPNLPVQRKQEIEVKRQALKEQIEMTIALQKQRNEPLNQVLSQIQDEGSRLESEAVADDLNLDTHNQENQRNEVNLMDCSDGVMCGKGN